MKFLKYIGIWLITFFIGTFLVWLISNIIMLKNEEIFVSTVVPLLEAVNNKNEKNDLRVFNVEGFWDKSYKQSNKRLLETGEATNGEDFHVKSGEIWLGLFSKNGQDILRPTKLKVSISKDGNFVWKKISVNEKRNPLFLVKPSKNFKKGKIKTLFHPKVWQETGDEDDSISMTEGFSQKYLLDGKQYTLRVEKAVSEKQDTILVLLLETENTSQLIHYISFSEKGDYTADLKWVGDLDNDGKLDLYMEFYNYEKGGYKTGLFISSEAKKGNLVEKIEYFASSAC